MRTLIVTVIALAVTTAPLAPQDPSRRGPPDTATARAELLRQQAELLRRHEELQGQLARATAEDRLAELRELEAAIASRNTELVQSAERVEDQAALLEADAALAQEMARQAGSLALVEERMRQAELDFERALDRLYRVGPRAAWAPQDPADSLWRAARERLNRGDHVEAARLFARIHSDQRYRQSAYRAEALYWHAFALNRMGTDPSVRQALGLLTQLTREYPADQRPADAIALLTTVQVRLAERGNELAERELRVAAEADRARAVERARASHEETLAGARSGRVEVAEAERLRQIAEERARIDRVVASAGRSGARRGLPLTAMATPPQCAGDDAQIRLIALNSLARMDTAASLSVLREVMARRDECAAPLRQSALLIAARLQNQETEDLLAEAARSDPEPAVRRTALVYLGSRNVERAAFIGQAALQAASEDQTREWLIQALAQTKDDRAWSVLREYAGRSDVSSSTRRMAISMLAQSGDSANAAFVRGLYERVGEDRDLKEAIIISAASRPGRMDTGWLMAIARDANEDARLRELIISALGRNAEAQTAAFVAIYDQTSDRRVKQSTLRVLAQRATTDTAAVDKLITIARNETDAELRRIAVMGLAESDDPRAVEVLLEIVRR